MVLIIYINKYMKKIKYNAFLTFIEDLKKKHAEVGILKSSNIDNRAQIMYNNITDFGSHALGSGDRDPIYKNTNIKDMSKFMKNTLIHMLNEGNLNVDEYYTKIGEKMKSFIEDDIFTKGHGTWRENTDRTKLLKARSSNSVIRSHANDIYISEGKILQSLSFEVVDN